MFFTCRFLKIWPDIQHLPPKVINIVSLSADSMSSLFYLRLWQYSYLSSVMRNFSASVHANYHQPFLTGGTNCLLQPFKLTSRAIQYDMPIKGGQDSFEVWRWWRRMYSSIVNYSIEKTLQSSKGEMNSKLEQSCLSQPSWANSSSSFLNLSLQTMCILIWTQLFQLNIFMHACQSWSPFLKLYQSFRFDFSSSVIMTLTLSFAAPHIQPRILWRTRWWHYSSLGTCWGDEKVWSWTGRENVYSEQNVSDFIQWKERKSCFDLKLHRNFRHISGHLQNIQIPVSSARWRNKR